MILTSSSNEVLRGFQFSKVLAFVGSPSSCSTSDHKPPPLTLLNFSTDGEAATGVHNRSKKTEKDTEKGKERDSPAFLTTAIASDYKKTISSRAK